MKWEQALVGYWLEKRRNVSPKTVADYSGTFKKFSIFLGTKVEFEEIKPDHIRQFLAGLAVDGLSQKSVANAWIALSSLWTWAEKELDLAHIIRRRVARPKYQRPIIEPYSKSDIGSMLNACSENAEWTSRRGKQVKSLRYQKLRDRAIILLLVDTGLRASELCNLLVKDYDSATGRIQVRHGKGNKSRLIYTGESARKAIWRYLTERKETRPNNPIFVTGTGAAIHPGALRNLVNLCAKRAGVPRATVHKFRHTFAINFLRNGGSVLELQRILGHEQLSTVRIYASLADSDIQEAQRKASPADNWRF
jgi:integrase/recombinase XerD